MAEALEAIRLLSAGKEVWERETRALEDEFAAWLGVPRAFYVSSARTALAVILQALDLPAGTAVLVPAWTHASVPLVVAASGLRPQFVDIHPETLVAQPDAAAAVAVATHLYGYPVDVDAIRCDVVIEDCAQACGLVLRNGRRAGSVGHAAIFSLSLTKNFTTLGGGMIAVRDPVLARKLDQVMQSRGRWEDAVAFVKLILAIAVSGALFGWTLYPVLRAGWLLGRDVLHPLFDEKPEFRKQPPATPGPAHAALGRKLLPRLDEANDRRSRNGRWLATRLSGLAGLEVPPLDGLFTSFVVRRKNRLAFMKALLEKGVDTSPGYLRACTRIERLKGYATPCPVAEALEDQQVHLPVYPQLEDRDLEHIAQTVQEVHRQLG